MCHSRNTAKKRQRVCAASPGEIARFDTVQSRRFETGPPPRHRAESQGRASRARRVTAVTATTRVGVPGGPRPRLMRAAPWPRPRRAVAGARRARAHHFRRQPSRMLIGVNANRHDIVPISIRYRHDISTMPTRYQQDIPSISTR